MSLSEQVLAQAQELTGEMEGKDLALLTALCNSCITALTKRLKSGIYPEDCEGAFVMAAAFQAVGAFPAAINESSDIQEFKAGDLSIRQDQSTKHSGSDFGMLADQAEALMKPYLKDRFQFTGV